MLWRRLRPLTPLLLTLVMVGCGDDGPMEVEDSANGSSSTTMTSTPPLTSSTDEPGTTEIADGSSATAGGGQDCCSVHDQEGCNDPVIAACVCDQEAFCCAFDWDAGCVMLAEQCGGCGGATTNPTDTEGGTGDNMACCTPSMDTPGCAEDPGVEACVCGMDPFCCEMAWDPKCVGIAEASCGVTCGGGGDCCSPAMGTGCEDPVIQDCVCAVDPFCCDQQWDDICVAEVQYECGADCGFPPPGGDCCMPHDSPECDDVMLSECVCAIDNGCCLFPWDNDCITVAVTQCGQVCEGFVPPDPCCMPNGSPGCGDMALEMCVCGIDPFCCDTEWDGQCVDEANNDCGGCMGGGGTGGSSGGSDSGGSDSGGGMGNCCAANGTPGCNDPAVEACVCASLPSCCAVEWSAPCVDEADMACMAMCPGPPP